MKNDLSLIGWLSTIWNQCQNEKNVDDGTNYFVVKRVWKVFIFVTF